MSTATTDRRHALPLPSLSAPHLERVDALSLLVERVHQVHLEEKEEEEEKRKQKPERKQACERREEKCEKKTAIFSRFFFFFFFFSDLHHPILKKKKKNADTALSHRFYISPIPTCPLLRCPRPRSQRAARSSSRAGRRGGPCTGTRRSGTRPRARSCRSCSAGSRSSPW